MSQMISSAERDKFQGGK